MVVKRALNIYEHCKFSCSTPCMIDERLKRGSVACVSSSLKHRKSRAAIEACFSCNRKGPYFLYTYIYWSSSKLLHLHDRCFYLSSKQQQQHYHQQQQPLLLHLLVLKLLLIVVSSNALVRFDNIACLVSVISNAKQNLSRSLIHTYLYKVCYSL